MDGLAYRHGKMTGDARCYQFHDSAPNGEVEQQETAVGHYPLGASVRERLGELLAPEDIDLLYLRYVAGWTQADIARQRDCHRSTIKRREDYILRTIRADPHLRQAAGVRACSATRSPIYEGTE
jgi:hypothetical protein